MLNNKTTANMKTSTLAFLLIAILLLALALRVWGIAHDLPYVYHPDEPAITLRSLRMLKTGDLNPHFFHWPSLPIYLNALAYVPYYLLGRVLGGFKSPADVLPPRQLAMGVVHSPMPTTILLGRLITLGFGIGCVVLVFLIGRRLTGIDWVGLLAALMVALSPTCVAHSRSTTPDTFAVFFILATAYVSLLVFQEGRTWQYLLAGAFVGLAASSKYNAALILVMLLAAHFLRHGWQGFKKGNLYLALASSGLAFLLTTPFALLDFPKFWEDLQFDRKHYSTGHAGMEGDTLRWYLDYLLRVSGPASVLAVLAIIGAFVTRSKVVVLAAIFPIVYFLTISQLVVRNERTILPLIPFIFLLAAVLLIALVQRMIRLQGKMSRRVSIFLVFTLLVASVGIPAKNTLQAGFKLNTVDSRETARIWIEDNLPPGAKVALESYAPFVDPQQFSVLGVARITDHPPEWYIDQDFDYLVLSAGIYGRFFEDRDSYTVEVAQYENFFSRLELIKTFTDGGFEVRVYRVTTEQESL